MSTAEAPQSVPAQTSAQSGGPGDPSAALRRSTWWWLRAAAILATIFLSVQLLGVVQSLLGAVLNVVLYLLFGAVVALLAAPFVRVLGERLRMPRTAAILLTLLCGAALVGLFAFLVAGPIVTEASQLVKQGPRIVSNINSALDSARSALAQHGIQLGGSSLSNVISGDVTSRVAGTALTLVTSVFSIALDILLTLVVAFWLLKDGDALRAGVVGLLPGRARSEAEFALDAIDVVVGGYLRAQLVLAVVVGALAGAGALLVGVPYPIVVGLATAVFELVPLVGPFLGGGFATILALTRNPQTALATVLLFVVIHIIEGYLLAPRIQARFVRLHPLVTVLVLFGGIEVGGFLGAFLAVPLASLVAVFVRAAMGDARSRHPELFRAQRRDQYLERRRRRLLGEFRLFRRRTAAPAEEKN
ncbi:MAG: AI-2E family transporter [Candidatus Dormibacteria bacterium]